MAKQLTIPELIDLCVVKAAPSAAQDVKKQEWPNGCPYIFRVPRRGGGVLFVIEDPADESLRVTARGATKKDAVLAMVTKLGLTPDVKE